ncbi:MAG TPA: 50S ribosomal protein L3 [Candidatus Sulfotelmatobacter sp.]|jgi:large subunit ribosomal protein L3|nr:50S ribosomal protein L3 [Candidatus Sulfotelmatobacter sp.]
MLQTLIGQKIDQVQTFLENGKRIPVTEVSVADNFVVQIKTDEKDKYTAVQLGVGTKKKPIKALAGHSKKAGLKSVPTLIREVAWIGDDELPKSGDIVTVETVFKPGDIVKITGTSKGKGFAGTVKRYNFRGGPKTHGQSDRHRAPGSIGQGTTPGRVYKGKRMAGHMGVDVVTISNLVVVAVEPENKRLYVLGLVPGNKKSAVVITKTGEQKKFVKLLSVKQKEEAEAIKEAAILAKEQEKEAAEEAKATPVEMTQAAEETFITSQETVADATEAVKMETESESMAPVADEEQKEAVKEGETNDGK